MVAPVITSPLALTVYKDVPFFYQITADNLPTSFALDYSIADGPAGIFIDTGTGLIQGTNFRGGNFVVNITATNADGSDVKVLKLAVMVASSAACEDKILQQLYEARANYMTQKLSLSTKKKPGYDIDGQKVDWVEYLKYIDTQMAAIQQMIIVYEGPFEYITLGHT